MPSPTGRPREQGVPGGVAGGVDHPKVLLLPAIGHPPERAAHQQRSSCVGARREGGFLAAARRLFPAAGADPLRPPRRRPPPIHRPLQDRLASEPARPALRPLPPRGPPRVLRPGPQRRLRPRPLQPQGARQAPRQAAAAPLPQVPRGRGRQRGRTAQLEQGDVTGENGFLGTFETKNRKNFSKIFDLKIRF